MKHRTDKNAVVVVYGSVLAGSDRVFGRVELGDGLANVEEEAIRRLLRIPVLYRSW
jgi:hypothetical protein